MTPVVQLYWIRVGLGIVAGVLSGYIAFLINATDYTGLVNAFTIALIVYLISYYPLKAAYKNKIEKQSQILSTAIIMYFLTWLPFLIIFYTIFKIYL